MGIDLVGDEGIAVLGDGEKAAEPGLGVVDGGGKQQFALVRSEKRTVVGDQLRGGAVNAKSARDYSERPEPTRMLVDRRQKAAGSRGKRTVDTAAGAPANSDLRVSKSMRGSIHMYIRSEMSSQHEADAARRCRGLQRSPASNPRRPRPSSDRRWSMRSEPPKKAPMEAPGKPAMTQHTAVAEDVAVSTRRSWPSARAVTTYRRRISSRNEFLVSSVEVAKAPTAMATMGSAMCQK